MRYLATVMPGPRANRSQYPEEISSKKGGQLSFGQSPPYGRVNRNGAISQRECVIRHGKQSWWKFSGSLLLT